MSSARQQLVQWGIAAVVGAALALGVAAWLGKDPAPSGPTTPRDAKALSAPSAPPPAPSADARADGAPLDAAVGEQGDLAPAEAPSPTTLPTADSSDGEAIGAAAALGLRADPPELRVWSNTRVRLWAEPGPGASFDRYVWHFEDGSDPVEGKSVEHVFAESVRDRHVSVEALRAGEVPVVVTLRLPVERLEVVPVDGAAEAEATLPAKSGPRLLFVGADATADDAGEVVATAVRVRADLVAVAADAATAQAVGAAAAGTAPSLAVVHVPAAVDPATPALSVVRNPSEKLTILPGPGGGAPVLALGELALGAVDTRADTVGEPELQRLRATLQILGAYKASLLLSARPLTLLRDGELIADRAYRIYEHALRAGVGAVVSSASGVFCQGRFGALQAVSVGQVRAEGCPRPSGGSGCQPGSLTVVDAGGHGRVRAHVLTGPGFARVVPTRELPAEVGKLRR